MSVKRFHHSDTDPEMERVQISLIRQASVSKRLACMASLSECVIRLSRRAIAEAHPDWDKQQVDTAFVALHHGEELAASFRKYLKQRNHAADRRSEIVTTGDGHS